MTDWSHAITALISGGAGLVAAWIARLGQRRDTDRTVDAKLEEHRDQLTFDLLRAAREERAAPRPATGARRSAARC